MVERTESRRSRRGALRPGCRPYTVNGAKASGAVMIVSPAHPFFVMAAQAAIHASVRAASPGTGAKVPPLSHPHLPWRVAWIPACAGMTFFRTWW